MLVFYLLSGSQWLESFHKSYLPLTLAAIGHYSSERRLSHISGIDSIKTNYQITRILIGLFNIMRYS